MTAGVEPGGTSPALRQWLDAFIAGRTGECARGYVDALESEERRETGQFYTPPAIAAAIARWAVEPFEDPRVLDPATGGGVFLLAALDALIDEGDDPAEVLPSLVGVDNEPVPLALTGRRLLAAAGADAAPLGLYNADFFETVPGSGDAAVDDGCGGPALGRFDAVVGNPPYVRQETLDIDATRAHLAAFGPPGETPYLDGDRALSSRSDAYVYFVTHATRFLRHGGRLGVLVPRKWLSTRYGESFQRFLWDHYRVDAIVGFGSRPLDDALVDPVLLLAERTRDGETDPSERVGDAAGDAEPSVTRFVRIDEPLSPEGVLDRVAGRTPDDDHARTLEVSGDAIGGEGVGKRGHYLDAPEDVVRLLASDAFAPLSAFGSVTRGVTTGANDFFFVDPETRERFGIADRFLQPAVKSNREFDGSVLTADDLDRWLLDVHDYVDSVADGDHRYGGEASAAVRDALVADGHDGLAAYVERGERAGYHERASCADRRVWFDLGPLSPPPVLLPKFFDREVSVVVNPDRAMPGNAVDCLRLDDAVPTAAVVAVLNGTVAAVALEAWGRTEGGGALQLMTYEMASLPVMDVRELPGSARGDLADAGEAFAHGRASQDRLDRAIRDAAATLDLPVDLDPDRLRAHRERMCERRTGRAADATCPIRFDP